MSLFRDVTIKCFGEDHMMLKPKSGDNMKSKRPRILITSDDDDEPAPPKRMNWRKINIPYWRQLVAFILPFALLPLCLAFKTNIYAGRCGYVMILMGCYWIFELLPIPITGLLPAILFPLLGIQKAHNVASSYFQDSVMLFVGGLLVATAVEQTNLHQRIALRVLLLVGSKPQWVMAGFMVISAGLSMFISNTATTAMILPIAIAVVMELNKQRMHMSASRSTLQSGVSMKPLGTSASVQEFSSLKVQQNNGAMCSTANIADIAERSPEYDNLKFEDFPPRQQEISKALVLSVAYAASIGGMATLTGTLTNVVFVGQFKELFPPNNAVTYASFSFFAFPTMIICLIFAWCWLSFQYFLVPYLRTRESDSDPEMQENIKCMLQKRYRQLGPWRFAEGSVLALFLTLVLLWFFRAPGFIDGWDIAFRGGYVSDATPAVLIGFILFIWPNTNPFRKVERFPDAKYQAILRWKETTARFPWDVVLLLGGALALAEGVSVSGLTDILGEQLRALSYLPDAAMVVMLSLIVTFCTEVASNAAIASIFLPIVAKLAVNTGVHPLYYMLPVTLSCSFAFMFPVATPPNAIAFGCGFLKVIDMVKAGIMLNFGCMGLMIASLHVFGELVFKLSVMPDWAGSIVTTALAVTVPTVSSTSVPTVLNTSTTTFS